MNSFRDCLARNKVLFETVAATLLSTMAIVVSFAQREPEGQVWQTDTV